MTTSKEKIELKADLANHSGFMSFIEDKLLQGKLTEGARLKVITACEEIISNVINYAYQDHNGNLSISYFENSEVVSIVFIDCGSKFNPLEKKDIDTSLPLEERQIGGLGIYMVKQLMDDVKYEYVDNKNQLTILKSIE